MLKRVGCILLLLGVLASLPVLAIDFHHSRTDGQYVIQTSIGQQSSNQAFNIFDSLMDAAASTFAVYWLGDIQESGGTPQTAPPFGNYPPTAALQDNRPQDDDVDWSTWIPVQEKTVGMPAGPVARPLFTPNVPQAWSPVELDLDQGTVGPDHFLVGVSFEPTTVGGVNNRREQVLNAYYPQTAAGLPGNDPNNTTGPMGRARGTIAPFWKDTATGRPGLLIRDLEPLRTQSNTLLVPGAGVVTQPPILARVPANYKTSGNTQSEVLPVVYLVVGTGENGDYAHIICLSLKRPISQNGQPDYIPDPTTATGATILNPVEPPDPDNFNPNTGSGGAVMWSYRVEDSLGQPMPVAGISFANVGTTADSKPLLFVTTSKVDAMTGKPSDGEVLCINAKAADLEASSSDGDPRAGELLWKYVNETFTPASTAVTERPGFWYGMAPAVCRVPLNNVFPGGTNDDSRNTITRAIDNHNVSEWEVFVADTAGIFRAFEAPGKPLPNPSNANTNFLKRWQDIPLNGANQPDYRMDPSGTVAERFIVPPVVYQGNTPLTTTNGSLVNGSTDVGFDDEVIFSSEKGRLYVMDAIGRFQVSKTNAGNNDGRPEGVTDLRWRWPEDDTSLNPATPMSGDPEEPRNWPRQLPNPNHIATATYDDYIQRELGDDIDVDADYFSRSALAVTLGANTNPNGFSPNLDLGDDAIVVPYMENQGTDAGPPVRQKFYEYVGSVKPYGFVQMSRPITLLTKVEATFGGNTYNVPLDHVRVGTIKTNGISSTESEFILPPSSIGGAAVNNPNFERGITAEDTIYVVSPVWFDEGTDTYVRLPPNGTATITVEYEAPTSPTNATTQTVNETLPYPSCYRAEYDDPTDFLNPTIRRSRASLSVDHNRLQMRRRAQSGVPATPWTLTDEDPALVDSTLFTTHGWRPANMMASGSANTSGTIMVPTWFRGRIIAFSNRLRTLRVVLGCYDPRLDPNVGGSPVTPYGPTGREFRYDPGVLWTDSGGTTPFLADEPLITDVSTSVVLVDGWMYVMYRNGHIRAFSNVGGGAAGTQYYPPVFYPPQGTTNNGNLVKAPYRDPSDLNRGIHITTTPDDPTNTANYVDINGTLDQSVMVEMGQTLYVVVDFGPESELARPETIDVNADPTPGGGQDDIDMQVLQYEVQAQIRSSNGAVQQLPGLNRGVRPTSWPSASGNRILAVVPVYTGQPSPTNPLTPGTPLLWELPSSDDYANNSTGQTPGDGTADNAFTGQVTYDLQVTQQGVQWRWPDAVSPAVDFSGSANATKQHFWETEPNNNNIRFPTTAWTTTNAPAAEPPTTAKWSWSSEWAPLISYNNPIMLGYDPDGTNGNNVSGIYTPTGPTDTIGAVNYTTRNQRGRKNGDSYEDLSKDGARSGSGTPLVPTVGMAVLGTGAGASATRQILFGDHGRSTLPSGTGMPDLAKIRVADRSLLASNGRALSLRIQPAPLTKMGMGALVGRTAGGNDAALASLDSSFNVPQGSFEQNVRSWDDGPDGAYSSIPENRINVTKDGTNLNLVNSPITVPGRVQMGSAWALPTLYDTTNPSLTQGEKLAVQVDIPRYTADDVYSTRWRSGSQRGADPRPISMGGSLFNPFSPNGGAIAGVAGRVLRDRAEKFARGSSQNQSGPPPANGEDPGAASALDPVNQHFDDRLRRVVVYNDANGNGQLDLLPTYREAYRTFAVQVVVKPEMKLEASQQVLDLGALWHGKKQPGMPGGGVNEIREWQRMNVMRTSGTNPDTNLAAFYQQYWRQFNLYNTGNVNLSMVKPEVAYSSPTSGLQLIGFPSEGNDPWRSLSLLAGLTPVGGGPNPLTDPYQIFLRTSFDDQLLPGSAAYGTAQQGIWLQKAPAGSSQPGAVTYAERTASGVALQRDPTFVNGSNVQTAEPRETWLTLNIPTGAALGQYNGSIRFYNDRTVSFQENAGAGVGYTYTRPAAATTLDGVLQRDNTGEPLEPATDSPVRVKAKIIENLVHGRYLTAAGAKDPQDRRMMPAAVSDASQSPNGQVQRIILAYAGNRNGLGSGQPSLYDLFGTTLQFDTGRFLFPYDELPLDRAPWADMPNMGYGWTGLTTLGAGSKVSRPSAVQDPNGVGVLAWTQQTTQGAGSDLYRILYQPLSGGTQYTIQPGGQPLDPRIQRTGIRLLSDPAGYWLAMYAAGTGTRRTLSYTTVATANLSTPTAWTPENMLATSAALTTINDPTAFTTEALTRTAALPNDPNQPAHIQAENQTIPPLAVVGYTGSNPRLGRSDVYLSRYRLAALTAASAKGTTNQQARDQEYAQFSFPRTEGDILKADTTRTLYLAGGVDFLIPTANLATVPTVGPGPIQLYLARPDVPNGTAGSLATPHPLIAPGQAAIGETPQGELVFSLNAALATTPTLRNVRILIDRSAGSFRLSLDARRLAGLLPPTTPALATTSPDPVLTADYTAATMRITRGSVSASDPVIVPVLSRPGQPAVMDASWYLQQMNPTAWTNGQPVAGQADRIWVFWRNTAGAVAGGPTSFYKVLRPGIRVRAGQMNSISFTLAGAWNPQTQVQEVNPGNGTIFFPLNAEGQRVQVTYTGPGGGAYTETHIVSWQDETGERPVPMENSVSEGTIDAFVSYEDATMLVNGSAANVRKMERIWMFWSSTRNSGGDIYYATLAPRIGPEVNVQGSIYYSASSPVSAAALARVSPNTARTLLQQFAVYERQHPPVVPRLSRRGPYVPTRSTALRTNRR